MVLVVFNKDRHPFAFLTKSDIIIFCGTTCFRVLQDISIKPRCRHCNWTRLKMNRTTCLSLDGDVHIEAGNLCPISSNSDIARMV